MELYNDGDIVITGISGRYPSSDSPNEFMKYLFDGVDLTNTDHGKWTQDPKGPSAKMGSFKDLDKCDAQFFGIIRKHCSSLDPVTRQFLERALEAIVDAGVNPLDLKGSNTGVFMSVAILETEMLLMSSNENETYGIMGRNRALNANRLSYWLDLKGPSYSADSLFNGGLQALQEAFRAIKLGKTDAALVGSGTTIVHPHSSEQFSQLNVLSADGNTRVFDAQASGYARSEAVNVIFMQRVRDAKRIHAELVHVLNQSMCTRTHGLLQEPVQDNWVKLLKKFYDDCDVDPKEVVYLEADGVANPRLDAIEMNAAGEIFCPGRTAENPLLIGSVKSNMGNAEGASNLCGLVKLIISFSKDLIPGNLHYQTPNPMIKDLVRGSMKVVTEATPLPGDLVALNGFGFGQTYGHLLLRKPRIQKKPVEVTPDTFPHILFASSRNEEGIKTVLDSIEEATFDPEYCSLVRDGFDRCLPGHMYRGYTVVPKQDVFIRESGHCPGERRPIWFLFSGMGAQWPTMGRTLMAIPTFKRSIDISAAVLKNHGVDLIYLLTHDDAALFDNIMHCFVCIVATQIAFTDVLRELGIEPDGIIGHSVGETSASYADGCLTQEQTILSAYFRGRASRETEVVRGMMAAVGLGYQQIKDRVPEGIEVACHNGPDSCTLSGPAEQVKSFVKQLSDEGVFARAVNVANIPYHSKYIKEMGPRMFDYLKHVIPSGKERSARWLSSSYPEADWNKPEAKMCDAAYHIHNLLSPVLFEEATKHIPDNAITIELSSHGLLQAIVKRSLPNCTNIGLTNRNSKNQLHVFFKALGTMYMSGLDPKVKNLYPRIQYPVSRGTGFTGHLVTWDHSDTWANLKGSFVKKSDQAACVIVPLDEEISVSKAYRSNGNMVLPYATYLVKVWELLATTKETTLEELPVTFTDVIFHKDAQVSNVRSITLEIIIQSGTGNFEVLTFNREASEQENLLVTGRIEVIVEKRAARKVIEEESMQEMAKDEFYGELLNFGHEYSDVLRTVSSVSQAAKSWKAKIDWNNDVTTLIESLLQIHILRGSDSARKVAKIRKIRQLVLDVKDLINEETGSHQAVVDLNLGATTFSTLEIRDVMFESEPRRTVEFAEEELNKPLIVLPTTSGSLQIKYLQFNGSEIEGKEVAYLAVEGGKRVIGLGSSGKSSGTVTADTILKWEVPRKWGIEDASSIPINYSMAYYAVRFAAQLDESSSVVISDAFSYLGLAAVRVALDVTKDVYTFVVTEEEKKIVQSLVPSLPAERILVNRTGLSEQLCLYLRKKCPKGVNVIINTGEADLVQLAVQCLKPFGCIVELSGKLFNTRGKLTNSYDYLRSASLISCAGVELCGKSETIKKQLQKIVADGIASGVVQPYPQQELRNWNDTQTVKLGNDSETSRFECDPEKAYLIIGGDAYSWLSLAEWFVERNAKNIIVVYKERTNFNASLNRRLLELEEKCRMVVKTAEKLSGKLIEHIFEVSRAKIALTFFTTLTFNEEPDNEVLDALLKQDTLLVSVLPTTSQALTYCKDEKKKAKTITIAWEQPLVGKIQSLLNAFDRLLQCKESTSVIVKEDKDDAGGAEDPLCEILPKNLQQLLSYGRTLPSEVSLTELKTRGLGVKYTKEIPALFIIPGLNRDAMIESFKELPNPAFVIDFPQNKAVSVAQYAAAIAPKMRSVVREPYVILGEGWGGAVAIETARLLERQGEETQLFLLGATQPDILNKWENIDEIEVSLLTRLFDITAQEVNNEATWEDRVNLCISKNPLGDDEELAKRSLRSLREKASSLLSFTDRTPIEGSVTCISRLNVPRSAISWMSKKDVPLTVVDPAEPLLNAAVFDQIQNGIFTRKLKL